MKRKNQVVFLTVLVFLTMPLLAQSWAPTDVTVSKTQSGFDIRVVKVTSLSAVLGQLCSRAEVRCDGVELTANLSVSPSRLSGSWENVIAELLDGAKLNYVVQPASSKNAIALLIQGRATGTDSPHSAVAEVNSWPTPDTPSAPNENVQSAFPSGELVSSPATGQESAAEAAPIGGSPMGDVGANGTPLTGGPIAENAEPAQYLPIPDNGRLIPTTPYHPEVLPFPDNGRLIPATQPDGSAAPYPLEVSPH
jgi:hypothetical protein